MFKLRLEYKRSWPRKGSGRERAFQVERTKGTRGQTSGGEQVNDVMWCRRVKEEKVQEEAGGVDGEQKKGVMSSDIYLKNATLDFW